MTQEFECNVCGEPFRATWLELHREIPSCSNCGSTVRHRQLAKALTSIASSMDNASITIVGISDHPIIQELLDRYPQVTYVNTYLDEAPTLDLENVQESWIGFADVLVVSDVLEHVMFPMTRALHGCLGVLKPGGSIVITMPYTLRGPSVEHYPWMKDYEVSADESGLPVVIGIDGDGIRLPILNPNFHGGPGRTLEMRMLELSVVLEAIESAGFQSVRVDDQDDVTSGIKVFESMGVITAQRPADSQSTASGG